MKIKKLLTNSSPANIISLLALIVSITSLAITWKENYERDKFNIIVSEDLVPARTIKIEFPSDGSKPYLTSRVKLTITNTSGIPQPFVNIYYTINNIHYIYGDSIYEADGTEMYLPRNIEPKSSLGIVIVVSVSLEEDVVKAIRNIYNLPDNISSADLGTNYDFIQKTIGVKFSADKSLLDMIWQDQLTELYFQSTSSNNLESVSISISIP